ncbi:MAG: PEP-CTERM sorting domain-containing protein [Oleiphilus sp.]
MKKSAFNSIQTFLLTSVLSTVSFTSSAAIIDSGSYFTDTDADLQWLDVTATVYRSYADISAQFGVGGEFTGWRYATINEFESLLASWTGVSGPINTQVFTTGTSPSVDGLSMLFGSTLDTLWIERFGQTWDSLQGYAEGEGIDYTLGILADSFMNDQTQRQVAAIWDNDAGSLDYYTTNDRQVELSTARFEIGSYLVRSASENQPDDEVTVTEPSHLILLGAGLFGLVLTRRKSYLQKIMI